MDSMTNTGVSGEERGETSADNTIDNIPSVSEAVSLRGNLTRESDSEGVPSIHGVGAGKITTVPMLHPPVPTSSSPLGFTSESDYERKAFLEIFTHITSISFGSLVYGDPVICTQLMETIPIMASTMKMRRKDDVKAEDICHKIVFDRYGVSLSKLGSKDERRNCFEAAQIMILYLYISRDGIIMKNNNEILSAYPEFRAIRNIHTEVTNLLRFRNMMVTAMRVIPPKNHKEQLLNIVTRIVEGRTKKYVTGSGESVETSSRVLIYRREGDIVPTPKRQRCRIDDDVGASESSEIGEESEGAIAKVERRKREPRNYHNNTDFGLRPNPPRTTESPVLAPTLYPLSSSPILVVPPLPSDRTEENSIEEAAIALRCLASTSKKMKTTHSEDMISSGSEVAITAVDEASIDEKEINSVIRSLSQSDQDVALKEVSSDCL